MPEVVGVRFKKCGKIYNFKLNAIDAKRGMRVVVESDMGLSIGFIVIEKHSIEESEQQIKKILRIATDKDLETENNNRSLEEEAKSFCTEKVKSRKLPMKIIGTEATLDRKRIIFYFTADGRIDFRELVRDLASKFKTRIEMRQIGVRDEVKHIGAMGICGKEVCCRTFLTTFEPISIRMAKKQELVLNPGKLSGICGRLMCCLGYEIEQPEKKEEILQKETAEETIVLTDENMPLVSIPDTDQKTGDVHQQAVADESPRKDVPKPQPAVVQETQKSAENEKADHQKRKDKGKPFSRRKKFFKKKKTHKR
jgi:cell fate regulator YaaT (PSP1 superfamily)